MFNIQIRLLFIAFLIEFPRIASQILPEPTINQKLSPRELMVDVTNHLGFQVLYFHSFANRNNIALSPCGLASVLVALFEGSDGQSALEIHQVMELPWDRDIVRIGYRDIHRRLQSYFYNGENLLSGLSLSKENVTIRPEYETILRFYGYDLDSKMISSTDAYKEVSETTTKASATTMKIGSDKKETTTERMSTTTTTSNMESIMPTLETLNEDIMDEEETTIPTPTTTEKPPMTTITALPTTITTSSKITTAATTTMMTTTTTHLPLPPPSTTPPTTPITSETTTEVTMEKTTPMYIFTFKPPKKPVPGNLDSTLETTTTAYESTLMPIAPAAVPLTRIPVQTTESPAQSREDDVFGRRKRRKPKSLLLLSGDRPQKRESASIRRQRSPIQYVISDYDFDIPGYFNINPIGTPNPSPYEISDYITQQQFELKHTDEDVVNHIFYLNRFESVQVPYKVYNTILKYGYLENIQASILEVELDSENYNLILIVPDYNYGLENVITALKSDFVPNLRDIRRRMRPTWVKAIVPKFNLKGHVILTNDLQNMGVTEIFEPKRADFSPMTDEADIYTRHVEQSITINIRTHSNEQLKRQTYFPNPVELSVNHPFLFFIVDTEIDLTLITGRILNPLNSRIQ